MNNSMYGIYFILFSCSYAVFAQDFQGRYYKAVIKYPVVDMCDTFPGGVQKLYFPSSLVYADHRAYQGLYNQAVYILEERALLCKVWVPQVQYHKNRSPFYNSFWVKKDSVVRFDNLSVPVRQAIPVWEYGKYPTVVLIYPWKNFSVGTRFRCIQEKSLSGDFYLVARPNFMTNKVEIDQIPSRFVLYEKEMSKHAQRKLFIKLLYNLLDYVDEEYGKDFEISYVWGGSTFLTPYPVHDFYQKGNFWYRSPVLVPYATGFDCSGLIMRIAHVVGIDFPWRNTNLMHLMLSDLKKTEKLQAGDLLWMPGHVMVVSDIKSHEVIEARGYKSGHGKVHKAYLNELFEGIKTYDELLKAYHQKEQVRLKDNNGKFYQQVSIKILKLTK